MNGGQRSTGAPGLLRRYGAVFRQAWHDRDQHSAPRLREHGAVAPQQARRRVQAGMA